MILSIFPLWFGDMLQLVCGGGGGGGKKQVGGWRGFGGAVKECEKRPPPDSYRHTTLGERLVCDSGELRLILSLSVKFCLKKKN